MKNVKGPLAVILAGASWGLISLFIKPMSAMGYTSMQICAMRTVFAALFMFLFLLIKDRSLLKIQIKDIWMFIGTGILSLTFFSCCYFTTIVNCGAAVAVVLLYTSPVFVMLMSALFFKEKLTARKLLCLCLTLCGCTLVAGLIGTSSPLLMKALLIGLGAGFGYALYSIFGTFATGKYSSLTITFYTLLLAGIALVIITGPSACIESVNVESFPYILGLAIVNTVIPYIAYTYGLSKMEAGKAAVLVTVEPLVGCLLGILLFKESVTVLKIIGIVLIFVSIILLSLPAKTKRKGSRP